MKILTLVQGTPEWHEHRATARNASDASAVMGESPYKTRTQLMNERATGVTPDISPELQKRFDRGHAIEELARPIAEAVIGDDLYPVIGTDDNDYLSASFDGLTMDGSIAWECKTANKAKLEEATIGDIPAADFWQCVQQLLVSGAEKLMYTLSDGTEEGSTHIWLTREHAADFFDELIRGWKQFDEDLESHTVREPEAEIIPAAQTQLPAVSVRLDGQIAVISNLDRFGAALTDYVDQLNLEPETDQEFADLEAACKNLKKSEEALAQAEDSALAQMDDVEQMRRAVAQYREVARQARLTGEKAVKAQKQAIKIKIAHEAKAQFDEHIATLNKALGGQYMPTIATDFNGAMKNKRTVDSLRSAANDECARARIEANRIAQRIEKNLEALQTVASAHQFLFADKVQLVQQHEPEALQAIVKQRVAEHEEAERKREEQIRAEERAKAEREAEEKQRREAEEKARAESEALEAAKPSLAARAEPEAAQQEKWADLEQARLMQNAGITSSEGMRNAAAPERPSDAEIIEIVANHYGVHVATAISWLNGIDTLQAGEELGLTA